MAMIRRVFRCKSLNPLHNPRLGRLSKFFERRYYCKPPNKNFNGWDIPEFEPYQDFCPGILFMSKVNIN